jgi:hypothetical protein
MNHFRPPSIVGALRCLLFVLLFCFGGMVAMAQEEETVVCPTCGQVMPGKYHFCGNCGAGLDGLPRRGTKPVSPSASASAKPPDGEKKFSLFNIVNPESALLTFFSSEFSGTPGGEHSSAFSDTPIALKPVPERPKPLLELGENNFLGSGAISPGFTIPTGAVWQPFLVLYGNGRSAFQIFDSGVYKSQITEEVNSLDLFANLYLTPTERIVLGIRPLEQNGDFAGYRFFPHASPEGNLNGSIHTLFFEGDFGELFPKLDPNDTRSIDYGFAVGRQPLSIQDGIMINDDAIDAASITRTSLFGLGASALRSTLMFGWNEINRNDDITDNRAKLIGFFNSADYSIGTVAFDAAYVNSRDADGLNLGLGLIKRYFGLLSTTFRVNTSFALDKPSAEASNGTLLTGQLSTVLPYGEDIVYLDGYWGIDNYSSADRGPDAAGPLGSTGILFANPDLGHYASPLGDRPNSSVGGALGFQKYLGSPDRQIVLEIGGRTATRVPAYFAASEPNEFALGARYQMKLNQHMILIFDSFVGFPQDRGTSYGFRTELSYKF